MMLGEDISPKQLRDKKKEKARLYALSLNDQISSRPGDHPFNTNKSNGVPSPTEMAAQNKNRNSKGGKNTSVESDMKQVSINLYTRFIRSVYG